MLKYLSILSVFLSAPYCLQAQTDSLYLDSLYTVYAKQAEKYYHDNEFLKAANEYNKAFYLGENLAYGTDRYNAACSWSLAGYADSAYKNLFIIAREFEYSGYVHVSIDPDLNPIRGDKRWAEFVSIIRANKAKKEEGMNTELIAVLDSIKISDQKGRFETDLIEEKYGRDSKELSELWQRINHQDSINLIKVKTILDEHGWLGPEEVGHNGSQTLFLVIQHSDIETQKEYLPMMREAVKNNKARASSLALLEDRVGIGTIGKQIYGSQIGIDEDGTYFVLPIEDPEHVDERRAEVGLGPLNEYTQNYDFEWDIETHKKRIEASEKK